MKSSLEITSENKNDYRAYIGMKQRLSKMSKNVITTLPVVGVASLILDIMFLIVFAKFLTVGFVLKNIFLTIPLMELTMCTTTLLGLKVRQEMCIRKFKKKYPYINTEFNEVYVERKIAEYEKYYEAKTAPANGVSTRVIRERNKITGEVKERTVFEADWEFMDRVKDFWLYEVNNQREKNKQKKLGTIK